MDQQQPDTTDQADEAPPILQSWKQLYWLVIILHAFIITLFYWFSHAYA